MSEPVGRVLPLEGVHNFRDFGGYALMDGGWLRRGVLWRSGQHYGASDADLVQIGALGLAMVFDLRGEDERLSHPCRRPAGFTARVWTMTDAQIQADARAQADADAGMAPHIAAARPRNSRPQTPQAMREAMRRHYTDMPFRPAMVAMLRIYADALIQQPGPSLIHCMAGKDRTGFAVAVLQRMLGVHADDVMADYLLTNTAGDQQARIAAGARTIRDRLGQDVAGEDVLRVVMAVEPEYLDTAFATIRGQVGDEEMYFTQTLGLPTQRREQLRAALAVSSPD